MSTREPIGFRQVGRADRRVRTHRHAAIGMAAFALLLVAGCHPAPVEQVSAGNLKLSVRLDPDPPVTGDNRLILTVRDEANRPVEGATIGFSYDMPAMGAMPEMRGGGSVSAKGGGEYVITYPLAMSGQWRISLSVQAGARPPAQLRLEVSPNHPGFNVVGGAQAAAAKTMLELSPAQQQLIGVVFGKVAQRPLALRLRAPGQVDVDEARIADVTLKYDAYVEQLFVSETGRTVKKGEPLLRLYSPELLAAEQDLLIAKKNAAAGLPGGGALLDSARRRLELWGLSAAQLSALEHGGKAESRVTLSAPASGVVLEKNVVEGTRVMAGTKLYRIGNLGQIWVLADFFERDAASVAVGQRASVSLPSRPGEALHGQVAFVYPTVDPRTRTLRARLAFPNPGLALKPGMYVDVSLEVPLGVRLSAPDRALLLSGTHAYAFVKRGPDHLEAVEVQVGARAGDYDEVLAGLKAGDEVATQANFLLSSEAQLKDALPRWSAP